MTCNYSLVDVFRFPNIRNLPNAAADYYYLSPDIFNNIKEYITMGDSLQAFINLCNKIPICRFDIPATVDGYENVATNINPTKSKSINEEHKNWVSKYNINLVMQDSDTLFLVLYEENSSPHKTYKSMLTPNLTKPKSGGEFDLKEAYSALNAK